MLLDSTFRLASCLTLVSVLLVFSSEKPTSARDNIIVSQREFSLAQVERAKTAISYQTWLGWAADQAKLIVPFYLDTKLRGNVAGVPLFNPLGLGGNLEEQTTSLHFQPLPNYEAEFSEIMDWLLDDNPTVARIFAEAADGMSTTDQYNLNLRAAVPILAAPIILIVLFRRYRTSLIEYTRAAIQVSSKIRPSSLAITAVGGLVIGFFVADGFSSYLGVLGSIPHMSISVWQFELPYKNGWSSRVLLCCFTPAG
jgi:hypothetical protein